MVNKRKKIRLNTFIKYKILHSTTKAQICEKYSHTHIQRIKIIKTNFSKNQIKKERKEGKKSFLESDRTKLSRTDVFNYVHTTELQMNSTGTIFCAKKKSPIWNRSRDLEIFLFMLLSVTIRDSHRRPNILEHLIQQHTANK